MADIVSLSFQTPEHMHVIGLLDEVPDDESKDLSTLVINCIKRIIKSRTLEYRYLRFFLRLSLVTYFKC